MSARDHLRGALVAGFGFAVLVLGFPGLDGAPAAARPEVRAQLGAMPAGRLRIAAADANRYVRSPVNRLLSPLQRPLRIAQSWNLYANGPARPTRLDILVDGALVHRSNDPEHAWLAEVLTYRRIRPIGQSLCAGQAKVQEGMLAYLRHRALADFPTAREVTVRCAVGRWADPDAYVEDIRYEMSAPAWHPTVRRRPR